MAATVLYCAAPSNQGEFTNRRNRRSRRGNEAEVFFAPKSASSPRRLPFLNTPCPSNLFAGCEEIGTRLCTTAPAAAPAPDLRTRAKTISDVEAHSSSPQPPPIGWERENRPPSVGRSNTLEAARAESG